MNANKKHGPVVMIRVGKRIDVEEVLEAIEGWVWAFHAANEPAFDLDLMLACLRRLAETYASRAYQTVLYWTCRPTPDRYPYELAVAAGDPERGVGVVFVVGDPGFAALEEAKDRIMQETVAAYLHR